MNNIKIILKKELKELFRDKKSLLMMLVIPILIPLIIFGMSALFDIQTNKSIEDFNKIGFAYELSAEEKELLDEINIDYVVADESNLNSRFNKKQIYAYITKKDNKYIINANNNDNSIYATELANNYLMQYKNELQNKFLTEKDIDSNKFNNIIIIDKSITEEDNFFANYIINYAFLFIIMAITVSATYPATDTTAGEKERGTLETTLTFPIKSNELLIGKYLSVTLSSIITGLLGLILALVSLWIAGNQFDIYKDVNLMMSAANVIISIIIILIFSFLISGICIAIASKAKTFKEAQSALTPLNFVCFFPGMIAFMASLKTTPLLSIIPFVNYTLIFTDVSNGNINYLNIMLMIFSTLLYIIVIIIVISRQYKSEKILF